MYRDIIATEVRRESILRANDYKSRSLLVLTLALTVSIPLSLSPIELELAEATADPGADFNGDGFSDLVIAAPFEDVGTIEDAGSVHVIYGSSAGLLATAAGDATGRSDQVWTQNSAGIEETAEAADLFGLQLAPGDFNGDGRTDLAASAQVEDVGSTNAAGVVHVIYGSSSGLLATAAGDGTGRSDQLWSQDTPSIDDTVEEFDRFGSSLAAGDFNGDGFYDLAIGVSGEEFDGIFEPGAVSVIYGSSTGLRASAAGDGTGRTDQIWTQNTPGIEDTAEGADQFGEIVRAGDFNNDGFADLAVGVRLEDIGTIDTAGAVHIIYGSSSGLRAFVAGDGTGRSDQLWTQDSAGIEDGAEQGDEFGEALSVGDYNGDGFDDLTIGAHSEAISGVFEGGAANVVYGSSSGLRATAAGDGTGRSDQFWHQNIPDIEDSVNGAVGESFPDMFAEAVSSGDFNGDGFDDLALGVWGEDVGTAADAGAVNVIYGSPTGLRATEAGDGTGRDDQFWHQDSPNVNDVAESTDFLGGSSIGYPIAAGDYNGDGFDDMSVGAPVESLGLVPAGAVNVIYGSSTGLSATAVPDQFWHQNISNIEGSNEDLDEFGMTLS